MQTAGNLAINLEQAALGLLLVLGIFVIALLVVMGKTWGQIARQERKFGFGAKTAIKIVLGLIIYGLFLVVWDRVPALLSSDYAWARLEEWAPARMVYVYWLAHAFAGLLLLYYVITSCFRTADGKNLIPVILGSLISGLTNTFVIYIINQTFNYENNFVNGLFYYFIFGLLVHVIAERFIRTRIAIITNKLVYEKRVQLIDKTLRIPFERLEHFDRGKINACLNNDTEKISEGMHIAVTGVTSMVTIFFCLIYLGMMSIWGLLLSLGIIVVTVVINLIIGGQAHKLYEQTRDIQNVFFNYIHDLLHGFKELTMNKKRKKDFQRGMEGACDDYRNKGMKADLKFANAFIVEDLIFLSVVGLVAFVFPLLFAEIRGEVLYNYIFIFLYMTGPVTYLLYSFPQILQIQVSWKRIQALLKEVTELEEQGYEEAGPSVPASSASLKLELDGVKYAYKHAEGDQFSIGPIDYEFRSGEVTFITGGNGSGKSTLAKIVTGLYRPDEGTVKINGVPQDPGSIREHISAIFSDFYLFDRLYGIDIQGREEEIQRLLEILQINDKVQITQGEFSTTKLSTGQKKRLALLVAYLEDRPICLFDEWAADQDPEYRKYFYLHLLPELKKRGKCVIAITHDDGYFHTADHVIKMELGKLTGLEVRNA